MYEKWKKPLIVILIILSLFAGWGFYFLSTHIKDDTFGWLRMVKSPTCLNCLIVADELVIKFNDDVSQNEISSMMNSIGGHILKVYTELDAYRVRIPDANSLEASKQKLEMDPNVEWVTYHEYAEWQ